jgi:probable selenium-dependent hydroxylase accessory protein YqeC
VRIEREDSLRRAFGIGPGDVVSIVGAGGKTSLMYRLVRELASAGIPVVATTTTKIWEPAEGTVPEVVLGEGNASHIEALRGVVAGSGMALSGSSVSGGKIIGHRPEFVDSIRTRNPGWVVVAECDGARGRSLKVPAAHEPPLPSLTTVYTVVIGADCLGSAVDSQNVFRPDDVARVAGVGLGAVVDDRIAAATVLSEDSYLGRKPVGAGMFVLVNKVVPDSALPGGGASAPARDYAVLLLARRLMSGGSLRGVVLGSVGTGRPDFAVLR